MLQRIQWQNKFCLLCRYSRCKSMDPCFLIGVSTEHGHSIVRLISCNPNEAQGTSLERSQWPCESSKSLYRTGSSELLPCLCLFTSKSHGLLLTQQHRPTSDIFPKRDRQPAFSRFNLPCWLISLYHRRRGQFSGN